MSDEWTAKLLREFLVSKVLRRVVNLLGFDPDGGAARVSLVASQIMGLVMARYVLKLEPLASASRNRSSPRSAPLSSVISPATSPYGRGHAPALSLVSGRTDVVGW